MSEMEEKLGAILNDPNAMQQIMAMARSLGAGTTEPVRNPQPAAPEETMIQQLAGMSRNTAVDHNQKALLTALSPYLSRERVGKLEKAMRAAKMASMASSFLNAGGLQLITGRGSHV